MCNNFHDLTREYKEYFVKLEPKLADEINFANKSEEETIKYYVKRNPKSIYLKSVEVKEILQIDN